MRRIEMSTHHRLHTVYLFDGSLSRPDIVVRLDCGDMDTIWAEPRAEYGAIVYISSRIENVLCVRGDRTDLDVACLDFFVTTSYKARMVRNHGHDDALPITL